MTAAGAQPSPWRAHGDAVLVIAVFVALGALLFRPGVVDWDGAAHYAYVHSAIIDGDLDFSNEIVPAEAATHTVNGHVGNLHPIGASLIWAPFFLAAHAMCAMVGAPVPGLCQDGYSWPYVTAISLASALCGLVGVWVTYRCASQLYPSRFSLLAVIALWLASPLLAFMFVVPSMPHAIAFGVSSVFLSFWWSVERGAGQLPWFVWGLLGGLLALVRWQAALWFVLPLALLLSWRAPVSHALQRIGVFALGALIVFTPQMIAWTILYGAPLTIPQGSGFLVWDRPAIVEVLFSPLHGLFAWMPIAILGCVGLWRLAPRASVLFIALTAIVVLQLYVNSIAQDWWGGGAFGPRRFTDTFPILMLGLTGLFDWARRSRVLLAALAVACVVLLIGHWLFMAEFFTALALPSEPLSWPQAITIAMTQNVSLRRWLILEPGLVGSWHMGPYGTLPSTLVHGLSFFVTGAAAIALVRFMAAQPQRMDKLWRAIALCLPFTVIAADIFLVRLR